MIEITVSEESLSKCIDGSAITFGQLVDILKENAQEFTEKLNNGQLKSINAKLLPEIQGFNSKIYYIDMYFEDETTEPFQIVMKTSFSSEDEQTYSTPDQIPLHIKECEFYRLFNKKAPIPMPKVYFIQKPNVEQKLPSFIFMENLSKKGIVLDYDAYIREEQVLAVVENIAKLHAYMLSIDEEEWRGSFVLRESLVIGGLLRKWIENGAKLRPGFLDPLIAKLSKFIDDPEGRNYAKSGCCKDLGIPLILIHGDLWNNNIIWKRNSDGSDSNEVLAFIDWQACSVGNPTFDIARNLVLCVEGTLRRKIEQYVIEFYYQKLQKYCTNSSKLESFSIENLKKAYAYALARQAVINVSYIEMREDPGPNASLEKQEAYKALIDRMMQNAKWALEDAVVGLEKMDPKWLS